MSVGGYVAGAVELAIVLGSLGFAATRLRARLLPAWEGAPARLAEAILGVALLVWVGELLGVVGLLREGSLVVACAGVGLGSVALRRPERRGEAAPAAPVEPLRCWSRSAWWRCCSPTGGSRPRSPSTTGSTTSTRSGTHLPYAADIAQSGSSTWLFTTPTTVFLNWFYPQNSELIHAMGMLVGTATHRPVHQPRLAARPAAAWCIGRPWGRGPHCIAAAALVLEARTLIFREPSGKNDVVAAALVLSAVALLVSGWAAQRSQTGAASSEHQAAPSAYRIDPMALAIAGLAAELPPSAPSSPCWRRWLR